MAAAASLRLGVLSVPRQDCFGPPSPLQWVRPLLLVDVRTLGFSEFGFDAFYGVVWCGAAWCGAVRCGVVWCGGVTCDDMTVCGVWCSQVCG
jgi:hypothetical protein